MQNRSVGVVLAGGASQRMGKYGDKLLLPVSQGGESILAHVIRILACVAKDVYVCYSNESTQSIVTEHLAGTFGNVAWIPDKRPIAGPVAAIAGAFRKIDMSDIDMVFTVAGDLPGLREEALHLLAAKLCDSKTDVAAAVRENRLQPLLAVWRPKIGETFSRLAEQGETRLMQTMHHCTIARVQFTGQRAWQIRPVHTPYDYDVWMDWRSRREEP